jgi:hypothetical protein
MLKVGDMIYWPKRIGLDRGSHGLKTLEDGSRAAEFGGRVYFRGDHRGGLGMISVMSFATEFCH